MASQPKDNKPSTRRRPPARTPEGRENQMVSLAHDLAERQLRDGTASAQVINHFLKLGTSRERLEQEKLQIEKDLLQARADAIASQARVEEMYKDALNAMRGYQGLPQEEESYED